MDFTEEEMVLLLDTEGTTIVGEARIISLDPTTLTHGKPSGVGFARVNITEAFERDTPLPVPSSFAETLGDACWSYAIWPLVSMKHKTLPGISHVSDSQAKVESEDDEEEEVMPSANPTVTPDSPSDEVVPDPKAANFTKRADWNMLEVILLSLEGSVPMAEGRVTLFLPSSCFENEALGHGHVGVAISGLLVEENSVHVRFQIPRYTKGSPHLVRWPLNYVLVKAVDLTLQQILDAGQPLRGRNIGHRLTSDSEKDSSEEDIVVEGPPTVGRKRHYNSTKRVPMTVEMKRLRDAKRKALLACKPESIQAASVHRCKCGRQCCREISLKVIEDCRMDYYGLPYNQRVEFIISRMVGRDEETTRNGQMVIDQKRVCKEYFWTVYGFSKATFYRYEEKILEGCKTGYHGNLGRKRPRSVTCIARANLYTILESIAEPMPHLEHDIGGGEHKVVYMLPSCYTKKTVRKELEDKMASQGENPIGKSAFYILWNESFSNYRIHQRGAFAKCDKCGELKKLLTGERRPAQRAELEALRDKHMKEQMSRRNIYYMNRAMARAYPEKYLCLIHDKMDQAKTSIPRLESNMKKFSMNGVIPLPMALTGMLTHGREPGTYCHLSPTGIWPGDPNFTISSITKCLRDLELHNGDHSGDLSRTTSPIEFFNCLLDQKAFKSTYMGGNPFDMSVYSATTNAEKENSRSTSFNPLPPILLLQMDNSSKDNKNHHVLAFCSELVIRGIFEQVEVSFLMVGHTHEDVDATFSKVSSRIKGKAVLTLPALMAEIWECESKHPVPFLIEEVVDYKSYVGKFLRNLVGHSVPIAFKFSMRDNSPIFQYMETVTSGWIPEGGRVLWRSEDGELSLPQGDPPVLKMADVHPRLSEVKPFLTGFADHLRKTFKDVTSRGYEIHLPLIHYWERVADSLDMIEAADDVAQSSFWPLTNHKTGYKKPSTSSEQTDPNMQVEEDDLELELRVAREERAIHFVGDPAEQERESFVPLEDIKEGSFVILRPTDAFERRIPNAIWLGRAKGAVDVDRSSEHAMQFEVEWWRPKHRVKNASDTIRYGQDLLRDGQFWEKDPGYTETSEWVEGGAAIYSWASRSKKVPHPNLKLPRLGVAAARNALRQAGAEKSEQQEKLRLSQLELERILQEQNERRDDVENAQEAENAGATDLST